MNTNKPTDLTFVVVKPDAVQRRLIGEIIGRFERKGLQIVWMKMLIMTRDQAQQLYSVHKGKSFYDMLIEFSTSGPVVVMLLRGKAAVSVARIMIGDTSGIGSFAGTIRGDFGISKSNRNLVHASDSPEAAECEAKVFITEAEFKSASNLPKPYDYGWLYSAWDHDGTV